MRKQAVLLGNANTKRTDFFMQAAATAQLPVLFIDWKDIKRWKSALTGAKQLMKIDPPLWDSCSLEDLTRLTNDYQRQLQELAQAAQRYPLEFFNHPSAIIQLLDKRICKTKLVQAGITVTKMLEEEEPGVWTTQKLLHTMQTKHLHQVFIKPVSGSGAAGVSAFRWQPSAGRMALYTCAMLHPAYGLVNTRRLRRFSARQEVLSYLDRILESDCIVERWYAKAQYQGDSYDMRAVLVDGKTEFLLARCSKGPITNLHLNNHPLKAEETGLPDHVLEEIDSLCKKAVECFPGLRIAGIDILLEKGSLRPRIIEMNAQGDLIYQDIYHENKIYRRQAELMYDWQKDG